MSERDPLTTVGTSNRPLAGRITSVDALRGLTVAFMILVNDPGDWSHVYAQLDHARWNGFTLTDLVFPMFLFLVGCSIVFSVSSRLARGTTRSAIAVQMLRRAAVLFAIKMALTAFPYFHMTRLRIFGVLTRIAICYLAAGLIFLYIRRPRSLVLLTVSILAGYWLLMRFVPIPGLGVPVRDFPILDPDRNLAAFLDRDFNAWCQRLLHTGVLFEKTRDPEGLLSTLPAVATTLCGVLAGLWLRASVRMRVQPLGLAAGGVVCLVLGASWSPWFPINKNLWTSSYVFFAAGWSLLTLGLFFWLFEVLKLQQRSAVARAMLWPLEIFGSNAMTAFVLSNLLVKLLSWWRLGDPGSHRISVWGWLYAHLFAFRGSTEATSLAFALAFVAVCFLPNWVLWRRRVFLRL